MSLAEEVLLPSPWPRMIGLPPFLAATICGSDREISLMAPKA